MAKIKELDIEELNDLRSRVRAKFEARCPGEVLKEVTFKGAYDDLRADILRAVPDVELSVSTQRLRKLFYYTNPAVCAAGQLEPLSFGRDFIEAIERYIDEEIKEKNNVEPSAQIPTTRPERRLAAWVLALAGVLLCLTWLANWLQPAQLKGWREDFNDVSSEGLRKNGWEVLDYDSVWFSKQIQDNGALTLYTLPGDYWVKKEEPRQIKNLLVKKIEGDEFNLIAKIDGFHPNQNYQTAGVFLLDKNLSRNNFYYAGENYYKNPDSLVGHQIIGFVQMEGGEVLSLGGKTKQELMEGIPTSERDFNGPVWIMLKMENDNLRLFARIHSFFQEREKPRKLNFKPAYVGIACFQGWTDPNGVPLCADTIPSYFDSIIFEPKKN